MVVSAKGDRTSRGRNAHITHTQLVQDVRLWLQPWLQQHVRLNGNVSPRPTNHVSNCKYPRHHNVGVVPARCSCGTFM